MLSFPNSKIVEKSLDQYKPGEHVVIIDENAFNIQRDECVVVDSFTLPPIKYEQTDITSCYVYVVDTLTGKLYALPKYRTAINPVNSIPVSGIEFGGTFEFATSLYIMLNSAYCDDDPDVCKGMDKTGIFYAADLETGDIRPFKGDTYVYPFDARILNICYKGERE